MNPGTHKKKTMEDLEYSLFSLKNGWEESHSYPEDSLIHKKKVLVVMMNGVYHVYVHNWPSSQIIDDVLPKNAIINTFVANHSEERDYGFLVRKIVRERNVKTALFIDFGLLPKMENILCSGDYESECDGEAFYWTVPEIDGYTTKKIPVCEEHKKFWENDFASCPFHSSDNIVFTTEEKKNKLKRIRAAVKNKKTINKKIKK